MSGYVKTFKVKDGDKDKNNKLMKNTFNEYENIFLYYKNNNYIKNRKI